MVVRYEKIASRSREFLSKGIYSRKLKISIVFVSFAIIIWLDIFCAVRYASFCLRELTLENYAVDLRPFVWIVFVVVIVMCGQQLLGVIIDSVLVFLNYGYFQSVF